MRFEGSQARSCRTCARPPLPGATPNPLWAVTVTMFLGMPANLQRFLPLLLVAFLLLFLLPSLLKKKSSSASSANTRAAQTIDAMNLIDKGEQSYHTGHGSYTSHLADLVTLDPRLARVIA